MACLDIFCSNLLNLKNKITKIEYKKYFVTHRTFWKIFHGPSYMPKIFHGPHRNSPSCSPFFILNVRSLKGLRFRKRFTLIHGKLLKWCVAASLYQKQFYLLTKVNYRSTARLNTWTFLFNIFITNLFIFVSSSCLINCTDDSTFYSSGVNLEEVKNILRADFDAVTRWF